MNTILATSTWQPQFAERMSGMQASEIRELLKAIEQPGVISFSGGIPDPKLFPHEDIREAYQHVLSDEAAAGRALQYSVSEGDPGLRKWIAAYMTKQGAICTPENILVTSGSQQALEFLGKLFLSKGNTALVTAPTYLGALQAFAPNQPIYDDLVHEGSNRTASSYQEAAAAAGSQLKFAYVVPDFANPTGETFNRQQRLDLIELVTDLDIPLIEDSPYSTLRFEGDHQPLIQSLDVAGQGTIDKSRVIYCGSFSKIFTPGLRIGWVCAAREVIEALVLIKQASDMNTPLINQWVMLHLAKHVFDAQVAKTCESYRVKRDLMLSRMEDALPDGSTWTQPHGGMFIWACLPKEYDSAELLADAVANHGVSYVPGHAFYFDGFERNTLRLSYTQPSCEEIEEGMLRLRAVFQKQNTPPISGRPARV